LLQHERDVQARHSPHDARAYNDRKEV
jgi:hypothetical protein